MTDPTPEQIAWARAAVRKARASGIPDTEIDHELRAQIGVGLKDVLQANPRDFGRSLAQGLTLGHADELAGLAAKITGGDYTTARDQVRNNQRESVATNPKSNVATEVAAGALPAMAASLIPGLGPKAGAGWFVNALRSMGLAGVTGGVLGEGQSEADTPREVAADAGQSAALSAATAGALSVGGAGLKHGVSEIRDAMDASRPIVREGATQLPADAASVMGRQEALAPGTAVPADLSPEMQALTRGVGADAQTGVAARLAAEARVQQLKQAVDKVSQKYDALNRPLPVDTELKDALADAGRKNVLKNAAREDASGRVEIEFKAVQRVRSELRAEARATKNSLIAADKFKAADRLSKWLVQHVPGVEQLDTDYKFLLERLKASEKTLEQITASSKNYAASRAYGTDGASVGGSLPTSSHISEVLAKLIQPDRATRAVAANNMLLQPNNTDALQRMLKMKALLNGRPNELFPALRAGLLGDLVPQASQGLLHP